MRGVPCPDKRRQNDSRWDDNRCYNADQSTGRHSVGGRTNVVPQYNIPRSIVLVVHGRHSGFGIWNFVSAPHIDCSNQSANSKERPEIQREIHFFEEVNVLGEKS